MLVVERLGVCGWWATVVPALLRARRRGAGTPVCRFIDASRAGLAIARASAPLLGVRVERFTFRLIDVRDDAGLPVRLRIGFGDLGVVVKDIAADPVFRQALAESRGGTRLPTYLTKRLASLTVSDPRVLWRALLLVHACRPGGRALDEKPATLVLARRPWFQHLVDYGARHGVEVLCGPAWPARRTREVLDRVIGPFGVEVLRDIARRLRGRSQRIAGERAPVIAVEHNEPNDLTDPRIQGGLFFWQRSALPAADLVAVQWLPIRDAERAVLRRAGVGMLAVHPGASAPDVPTFARLPRWSPHPRPTTAGADARWVHRETATYRLGVGYWEALFRANGVKVFVAWNRYDASHCMIADALEAAGGVTAVYQRAMQPDPSAETTVDADIMFGFGPSAAAVEQHSASRIRYHVSTGYLGDYRIELWRNEAREVRARLEARGARRIIAFYDENSLDDDRWEAGHGPQRAHYTAVLGRVLSDSELGLVLKPKVSRTLRNRLGPVATLLAEAEATGRCFVWQEGHSRNHVPPCAAALAADIAIHSQLSGTTAALEAALVGIPSLLLDSEGWAVSPLYELGRGHVIFTEWDDLWSACDEYWARGGRRARFGDWTPMLDDIDPFRDGRAAERMGTYLGWLLDSFKAGLGRERAMADAAERYGERWGKDKITEVRGCR